MIPFNKPPITGYEEKYLLESLNSSKISGDGDFTQSCRRWFESELTCEKALLTTSCTHALEMTAILLDIQQGDEVIMPSYTFVSTANAFVLRGAKIIFVDVRPDTMNIDERLIEGAITSKTKVIVPVHYAGVACEMDSIMAIATKYDLYVVEDAAQAMRSEYKGRALGTIGHLGVFSFHETKNYSSGGEGGLLIINDKQFTVRADIIREKGTNRTQFSRGVVDKYSWVDLGSSYLPNELSAAFLWGQLEGVDKIYDRRHAIWERYLGGFSLLKKSGLIELPHIPKGLMHNAHMFFIKLANIDVRTQFIRHLKEGGVMVVFHYIPLHSSPAGLKYGLFNGEDRFTTSESERLVRLPIYYNMTNAEVETVIRCVIGFFEK